MVAFWYVDCALPIKKLDFCNEKTAQVLYVSNVNRDKKMKGKAK